MRVLVADDDPVSLEFFAIALRELGCETVAVAAAASALVAAAAQAFDLALIDRNLPDARGPELLAQLRALGYAGPALATSAEIDARTVAELRDAGFAAQIEKPIALATLAAVLRPYLDIVVEPAAACRSHAVLDDDGALAAIGGDPSALRALRAMLARELESLARDLAALPCHDLAERMHRLRAACGFCGAPLLCSAAAELERWARSNEENFGERRSVFLDACNTTLEALRNADRAS